MSTEDRLKPTKHQVQSLGWMANDLSNREYDVEDIWRFVEKLFDVVIGIYGLERAEEFINGWRTGMTVQGVAGAEIEYSE